MKAQSKRTTREKVFVISLMADKVLDSDRIVCRHADILPAFEQVTNGTAPVLTPVSVISEPGHISSHVYLHVQGISGNHEWIPALTLDIHSCSRYLAIQCNNPRFVPVVWSLTPSFIRETVVAQRCWRRRVASSWEQD